MPNSPMSYLTELHMTEASGGHSAFEMPASPWFANSTGLIPGGMLAVIADACLGSVVHGDLPPAQFMTTAELSLTLPAPGRPGRRAQDHRRRAADPPRPHDGALRGVPVRSRATS